MRKMSNFGFSVSDVSGGNEGGRNHFGKLFSFFACLRLDLSIAGVNLCEVFVSSGVEIDDHSNSW